MSPISPISPISPAGPAGATTRRGVLPLLLTAAGGLSLAACGVTAAPGGADPRGAEVTPGKGAGGPVELVLGHFVPTRHEFHAQLLEPWAREVEGRSGGRLRITIHPGGSLGPAPAQYQNVTAGAMDIGLGVHSYTPGRFPLTESLELPFLWDSAGRATQALQALYRGVPALRREYADARVLALWANGPAQVMTTKKPVRGLDDLKGLKLRSPGRLHNRTIEALGGVPLSTAITEVYDALERGIAHGAINAPSTFSSFNLTEVIRHTALADVTVATFFLVMNKERWEALPGEAQALLDDLSGEALALRAAQVSDETEAAGAELASQKGVELYRLAPDELRRWKEAVAAVPRQWIAEAEGKGLPGRLVYEALAQHSPHSPGSPR